MPAWVAAKLYSKFFKKLEDQMTGDGEAQDGSGENESEEDERIFKDELDEGLVVEEK